MDVGSECGDGSRPSYSVLVQIGRTWHRIGWGWRAKMDAMFKWRKQKMVDRNAIE